VSAWKNAGISPSVEWEKHGENLWENTLKSHKIPTCWSFLAGEISEQKGGIFRFPDLITINQELGSFYGWGLEDLDRATSQGNIRPWQPQSFHDFW
jgi:hypothetical protein